MKEVRSASYISNDPISLSSNDWLFSVISNLVRTYSTVRGATFIRKSVPRSVRVILSHSVFSFQVTRQGDHPTDQRYSIRFRASKSLWLVYPARISSMRMPRASAHAPRRGKDEWSRALCDGSLPNPRLPQSTKYVHTHIYIYATLLR